MHSTLYKLNGAVRTNMILLHNTSKYFYYSLTLARSLRPVVATKAQDNMRHPENSGVRSKDERLIQFTLLVCVVATPWKYPGLSTLGNETHSTVWKSCR